MPEIVGSDARIYDSSTSMAVTANSAMDVPTLTKGGQGSYEVAFDVPAAAVEHATVRVTQNLSFDDAAALWATK